MNNYFEELKLKFWILSGLNEDYLEEWATQTYENYCDDVQAMAAFVTVLNHKCWCWYNEGNEELSKIYSDLYYKYNDLEWDWLEAHGTEEEKHWYFDTLD